jgi:ABC-type multidrug transport system fused ATPase/permease subunit
MLPWTLLGFSFGAYVQQRVAKSMHAQRLIMVGPAVSMYEFEPTEIPATIIHGDQDEVIPFAAARDYAAAHAIPADRGGWLRPFLPWPAAGITGSRGGTVSPLSLRGLTKSYGGQLVVDGFDLELEPGRCHGLLGPNGAGKTTTLRLSLGLIEADAGTVELLGHAMPAAAKEARQRVGVVPQVDSLDPDFTVAENLQPMAATSACPARPSPSAFPACWSSRDWPARPTPPSSPCPAA